MAKMRIIWVIVLGGMLSSCAAYHAQDAVCIARCEKTKSLCENSCKNDCSSCTTQRNAEAKKRYAHFLREKAIEGEVITRLLPSYKDPLQCRKVTCSCVQDYHTCLAACRGTIHTALRVAPVC